MDELNTTSYGENKEIAEDFSAFGGDMRLKIEEKIGKSIISKDKYLQVQ